MVYITGDLHGDLDRLKAPAMKKLRRKDTLIILGDFGFIWQGGEEEEKRLKWINKRKYKVLFLEGTHDNFELLSKYPEVEHAGGRAKKINSNMYQLMRGETYELEGKKIFCFGGGISDDADMRIDSGTWWPEEQPTEVQKERAWQTLAQNNNTVDYICTHMGPARFVRFLDFSVTESNEVELFLDEIAEKTEYKRWLFAAYHKDKGLGSKAVAVYKSVIELE